MSLRLRTAAARPELSPDAHSRCRCSSSPACASLVKKGSLHPTVGLHGAARPAAPVAALPAAPAAAAAALPAAPAANAADSLAPRLRDHLRQPAAAQGWFARRLPPRLEQADRAARRGGHGGGAPRVPAPAEDVADGGTFVVGNWECELGAAVPVDRFDSGAVLAAASTGASTVAAVAAGSAARAPFKPVVAGAARGRRSSRWRRAAAAPRRRRGRSPPLAARRRRRQRAGAASRGGGSDRRRPRPQRGRQGGLPGEGGPQARVRAAGAPARGAAVHVRLRDRAAARHVRAAAAGLHPRAHDGPRQVAAGARPRAHAAARRAARRAVRAQGGDRVPGVARRQLEERGDEVARLDEAAADAAAAVEAAAADAARDFVHCPPMELLIVSYEGFRTHADAWRRRTSSCSCATRATV